MIDYSCFNLSPLSISQILIALLLGICFLQSGGDKIIDYNGNLDWLKGHFSKSPFKNFVPLLFNIIIISELLSGFLCVLGIFDFLINNTKTLIFYGFIVGALSLIALFLGQRIAKDYDGAASLLGYFLVTIIGILSFGSI